jgi:hypothetical protein
MAAVLERERRVYDAHKADLLTSSAGQFALVHGDELIGTFTKFSEAYEEGVRRFGLEPFLVQQILAEETAMQLPALYVGALVVR